MEDTQDMENRENVDRKRGKRDAVRIVFIFIFASIFLFSSYKIFTILRGARQETAATEELADLIAKIEAEQKEKDEQNSTPSHPESSAANVTEGDYSADAMLPQYAALYEMNNDFFGWISIDDTVINYPVMYTPKSPEYYLRRGFDKKYALSGLPFIDAKCTPGANHYFIYGHNMNTGIMFHTIVDYEKKDYLEAHPIIHFDTLYEKADYQVMAMFRSQIFAEDDPSFKYYKHMDLKDPDEFDSFVKNVKRLSIHDTGIDAEYGDTLLTLSTCAYHTENGRFCVVAKKIRSTGNDKHTQTN